MGSGVPGPKLLYTGFNVYCGSTIWPHDEDALEKLTRYIIRAAFSQERMNYITTGLNIQNISCSRLAGPVAIASYPIPASKISIFE
ncbi:MAG: hypothetical protein C0403_11325 [Desulfobacterium sp.]|nr:hypothetical protein [Desulfobacterium sp.]